MGLVDYSESSGSESEPPAKPAAKPTQTSKKAFQKVVDRSNPGKIRVSLPQPIADGAVGPSDEPPAKRVRTGGGGGIFSDFGSFLPAPKNRVKPSGSGLKASVQLKTSAGPGFSRDTTDGDENSEGGLGLGLNLPPPKQQPQPEIPAEQKPEAEVKLVGKPLMFKPLSVARKPKKNGVKATLSKPISAMPFAPVQNQQSGAITQGSAASAPAVPKKVSLFSLPDASADLDEPSASPGGAYEPVFESANFGDAYGDQYGATNDYQNNASAIAQAAPTYAGQESLDTIANDLNLDATARRELFGRQRGAGQTATKVVNFNVDTEYQHNEGLRATGELQPVHNPVRAIAPGKHSLRQLINSVQSQREALEESFAKGKNSKKSGGSKYGW
jgi:hypothetical protein